MIKYCKLTDIKANNIGEIYMTTNLSHNLLKCAEYFFHYYDKPEKYRFWAQFIINLSSFYELFIKYKMTTIHKSLIWKDISKFNIEDYSQGEFVSIDAKKALIFAKNLNWLTDVEYDNISDIFQIRNKFCHFSLCEEDDYGHVKVAYFEGDFEKMHYGLVSNLLLSNKDLFVNNLEYERIIKEYINKPQNKGENK